MDFWEAVFDEAGRRPTLFTGPLFGVVDNGEPVDAESMLEGEAASAGEPTVPKTEIINKKPAIWRCASFISILVT